MREEDVGLWEDRDETGCEIRAIRSGDTDGGLQGSIGVAAVGERRRGTRETGRRRAERIAFLRWGFAGVCEAGIGRRVGSQLRRFRGRNGFGARMTRRVGRGLRGVIGSVRAVGLGRSEVCVRAGSEGTAVVELRRKRRSESRGHIVVVRVVGVCRRREVFRSIVGVGPIIGLVFAKNACGVHDGSGMWVSSFQRRDGGDGVELYIEQYLKTQDHPSGLRPPEQESIRYGMIAPRSDTGFLTMGLCTRNQMELKQGE